MNWCWLGIHKFDKWVYREERWTRQHYGVAIKLIKTFRKRECEICGCIKDQFVDDFKIMEN